MGPAQVVHFDASGSGSPPPALAEGNSQCVRSPPTSSAPRRGPSSWHACILATYPRYAYTLYNGPHAQSCSRWRPYTAPATASASTSGRMAERWRVAGHTTSHVSQKPAAGRAAFRTTFQEVALERAVI